MYRSLLFFTCVFTAALSAQPRLLRGPIRDGERTRFTGHVHPLATTDNDLGPLDASTTLPALTLVLRQTPEQQADLDKLLAAQQDPASPEYHRWLSPEQYADRFGASADDIAKITAWLEQHNLHVTSVGRARTSVAFTGTAGDVGQALQVNFHRYNAQGRDHFANTVEPSLPTALQPAVRGIHGLHDFRMQPHSVPRQVLDPNYTSTTSGNHYLSPDDLGSIYNIKALWNAGYDGTGQKIVIAGQTRINLADIQQFRSKFNLPAVDPQLILVPNTKDPGTVKGDLGEADLDLEWAGATAPQATLLYVYSQDVMDAVQYAIDQNLAPVLSLSYGLCESLTLHSDMLTMQSWARQANAQGMTWLNASGDSGGADCLSGSSTSGAGLAVDSPADIPEVTGIGGTTLNEGSGQYWNSSNNANGGSALVYIPEVVWNDSKAGDPASGGGGASTVFAQPSWQAGPGVPGNGRRNVPDIALSASADHDGYMVYSSGALSVYGGTSAGTPAFAGITAVLNQYLVSTGAQAVPGVGNINPRLYALAQTGSGVFHDVTTGDNIINVTCGARARNCVPGSYGYPAGQGYDQASGLGSVDAFNLVTSWRGSGASVTTGPPTISGLSNGASFQKAFAPGMVLSIFGTNLADGTWIASSVPLPVQVIGVSVTIGGVAAPFYYASSGQLNVQIPYETPAGQAVSVVVNNNGRTVSSTLTVAAAAPGLFTDAKGAIVPSSTVSRGGVVTLYLTGAGAVSPAVSTGAAPVAGTSAAQLPTPVNHAAVSIGGVAGTIEFIGIPTALVGVTQVNVRVPTTALLGTQSVVVTIGGIASAPATLTVTQ